MISLDDLAGLVNYFVILWTTITAKLNESMLYKPVRVGHRFIGHDLPIASAPTKVVHNAGSDDQVRWR